jgi:enoyl-CoA hydratase
VGDDERVMDRFIQIHRQPPLAIITLSRPERLNAWHAAMRQEVTRAFRGCNADPDVRAVVITGTGDRAFSAGQDLDEARQFTAERAAAWVQEWREMYGAIRDMDKPVVAAINGVAVGSAFQVALLCDLRVGHADIRMGQPEIDAGIPSTLGPWVMWDIIGRARTVELTLTGRLLDGAECLAWGLINEIVPRAEVLPRAIETASGLAGKPPIAMMLNKRRLRELTQAGFEEAERAGERLQREAFASGEPQAAMAAFFAARQARKKQPR